MPIELCSSSQWQNEYPKANDRDVSAALRDVYRATTIQERFDALATLIDQCQRAAANKQNRVVRPDYIALQEQAIEFAATIVGARNFNELKQKISDRHRYKSIDSEYMPWKTITTRTDVHRISSRKEYATAAVKQAAKNIINQSYSQVNAIDKIGDNENNVRYLSAAEREEYRIFPAGGKFKQIAIADDGSLQIVNFDTKNHAAHGHENNAIFVVSPKGDMFAATTINEVFHHSSFLAGNATVFAGTLSVTKGNLQDLTDNSGHYLPASVQNIRALAFLRAVGILDHKEESYKWSDELLRLNKISNIPEFTIMSMEVGDLVSSQALFTTAENHDSPLIKAVKSGKTAEVKRLSDEGYSLKQTDDDDRTPLLISVLNNDSSLFNYLITVSDPDAINMPDSDGVTPILLAVISKDSSILEQLLNKGADPNIATPGGITALTLAVFHQDAAAVNLLLENGARPQEGSKRMIELALCDSSGEMLRILSTPDYNIDFNPGLLSAIESSSWQQTLMFLTTLPGDQQYNNETLEALASASANLVSEFIYYLDDMNEDKRQHVVSEVLGQENSLGMLLEVSQMDRLKSKLNSNGYKNLVNNFEESRREKGRDIETAPAYVTPGRTAPSRIKGSDAKKTDIIEDGITTARYSPGRSGGY